MDELMQIKMQMRQKQREELVLQGATRKLEQMVIGAENQIARCKISL